MKKTISIAAALAVTGALILPTAAHATTGSTGDASAVAERSVDLDAGAISTKTVTFPEGGTWDYGTNSGTYSNYFHKTKKHATSVINGNATYKSSPNAAKNTWSKVSIFHTWTGNHAFYRFV